jgi:hypothetical protein
MRKLMALCCAVMVVTYADGIVLHPLYACTRRQEAALVALRFYNLRNRNNIIFTVSESEMRGVTPEIAGSCAEIVQEATGLQVRCDGIAYADEDPTSTVRDFNTEVYVNGVREAAGPYAFTGLLMLELLEHARVNG